MSARNRYSRSTQLGLALWLGAVGCAFNALDATALTPPHLWSQRFGGTSLDLGRSVAVDGSGNVVVTGYFQGTVNFGGGNLVTAGGTDIFVAKYDAAGVYQWSQRFGSTLNDFGFGVAFDGPGNVVVTGYFQGTVNFGGGNLVSAGSTDIFVAKYNAAGVHQWSQRFGSTSGDEGLAIAVDGAGNAVLTGYFVGTVNFGGSNLVSAGSDDIVVAKYDAAGVHQWSQRFGGTLSDLGRATAVDGAGNVVVAGSFNGTANFGGGNLVSAGSNDTFIAKYNAAGVHQWSQRFGSTGDDAVRAIAVDGPGNVVVTGYFTGTVNFGGGNLVSAGSYDIFVAKYDLAGVHQSSQRFGSTSDDYGFSIAMDGPGNAVVVGRFKSTVNFGGGNLVSAGSDDIFVAKYNAAGVHQWSQRLGASSADEGHDVAVDGVGNVVVTGYFQGTANFGGGNLVSAGSGDIFIAKYSPDLVEPVVASIVDVGNDQGRSVILVFSRSAAYDVASSPTPVVQYEAFRRNDPLPGLVLAGAESAPATSGWTFAGAIPAHHETEYTMIAPTLADSTITNGQYYSAFFIRAATADAGVFYDSPVDSGYSLDNLSPGVPTGFLYRAGTLSWDASRDADFDHFTIYGSSSDIFDASAIVVDDARGTSLDVTASAYAFYVVTSSDRAGNEGAPAVVKAATGADEGPRHYVLSVSAYPNPFNPVTTIRYTLPSRGRATIAIYDARGALVRTLLDAEKSAGAYTLRWDGRDDRGRPAVSGVYFARLGSGEITRSYKLVVLK